MKYATLIATTAALCLSAISHAQDNYVAGQFGLRAVEQTDSSAGAVDIDSELGNAAYYSVAFGRRHNNMRFELELARRGGEINSFAIGGTGQAVSGEGLTATSLMANAYVDFNTEGRVSPYLGGGLGLARVTADYTGAGGSVSGDASAVSFQLIGGASVQVSERIELFSDLRYLRVMETDHALTAPLGSSDVSFKYDGYTLGAGVRVSF
ncbi:outer membrane beta-barrel protein [Maricaulis sp.]|uniref:outer membrane protein n=1 Tax=Maricaulis sp. TaxID=1486257 RepID=UPI0025C65112|nr:outer membrane beta-barrel protein [Maricaulis sp.]